MSTDKDLHADARSFLANLSTTALLKRRDPQTKVLLEKAQHIIDGLLAETARHVPSASGGRSGGRAGTSMGQLWVKLDELKRENEDLKRKIRSTDDKTGSPNSPKSPKPQPSQSDSFKAEYQRAKAENESLKKQIEKLHKSVKEHQAHHSSLQDDLKRSKAALEAAQKTAVKAREDTKKMEKRLVSLQSEYESVKSKLSKAAHHSSPHKPPVSSPKPRPRGVSSLGSSSVGSSVVPVVGSSNGCVGDNRNTENISERCRPSTIAVAYTTLESQQWLDAKESLEDSADEDKVVQFLCDVIQNSFKVCTKAMHSVEIVIGHILSNPAAAVALLESGILSTSAPPAPDDIADLIKQKFRASYDKVKTGELAKLIQNSCDSSSPLLLHWSNDAFQSYLLHCSAISWQMAIQKPPMKLCTTDTQYDEHKHKLWWSCNQTKAKKIDYFIWPVLYDYEGGNLMVKGCVHAS